MTLGLITGLHNQISCADIGVDGITDADGLAVGRASGLVGSIMETLLDGCGWMTPSYIRTLLHWQTVKNLCIEPSSCACFRVLLVQQASDYLAVKDLTDSMANAVHSHQATGGGMVPMEEMQRYLRTRKGCTGIARLPCADARSRIQRASKQKRKDL